MCLLIQLAEVEDNSSLNIILAENTIVYKVDYTNISIRIYKEILRIMQLILFINKLVDIDFI